MTHVNGICELCKCRCVDFVEQFFCNCVKMCSRREKIWNMVSNQYEIALEVKLHNLSDYNLFNVLFGGTILFFSDAPFEHMDLYMAYCIWHIDMHGISLFTPIY